MVEIFWKQGDTRSVLKVSSRCFSRLFFISRLPFFLFNPNRPRNVCFKGKKISDFGKGPFSMHEHAHVLENIILVLYHKIGVSGGLLVVKKVSPKAALVGEHIHIGENISITHILFGLSADTDASKPPSRKRNNSVSRTKMANVRGLRPTEDDAFSFSGGAYLGSYSGKYISRWKKVIFIFYVHNISSGSHPPIGQLGGGDK